MLHLEHLLQDRLYRLRERFSAVVSSVGEIFHGISDLIPRAMQGRDESKARPRGYSSCPSSDPAFIRSVTQEDDVPFEKCGPDRHGQLPTA
jgi:hypothetical protein